MADNFEQVKQSLLEKYSVDEIQEFMELGAKVANMAVIKSLQAVIDMYVAKGKDAAEGAEIKQALGATLKYPQPSYLQVEFRETDMKLNICLTIVDRDYRTSIDIPSHDYADDLFKSYDALKQYAVAYWHAYMEEYKVIVDRLKAFIPEIDFNKMKMNKDNPTTLYFDEACPKRIGVFCYYVNSKGQPFYKKK